MANLEPGLIAQSWCVRPIALGAPQRQASNGRPDVILAFGNGEI